MTTQALTRESSLGAAAAARAVAALHSLFMLLWPLAVGVAAWQIVAMSQMFEPVLFPDVPTIAAATWKQWTTVDGLLDIGWTLFRVGSGVLIGSILGIGFGLWMGHSRIVRAFWIPWITVLLPIPILVWVPLFILWFGIGNVAVVLLVALGAFPAVILNTYTGISSIDEVLLRAARILETRGWALYTRVTLPAALPMVLSGLRLGIARGWRAAVAGELISVSAFGLGYRMFFGYTYLDTPSMFAAIVSIGIIGLLIEKAGFQLLESFTVKRWGTYRSDVAGGG